MREFADTIGQGYAMRNPGIDPVEVLKYVSREVKKHYKDQFENPDTYFVNELTENITKAIEELPENYRETFKLSRFGEQSNLQIAEALGVSIKTVEYRITQSLKILRVKLKDYLPFIMFLFA